MPVVAGGLLVLLPLACERSEGPTSPAGPSGAAAPSDGGAAPPQPQRGPKEGPRPAASSASAREPGAPATGSSSEADSLELLDLTLTSTIRDKEPGEAVQSVAPGKRLYVHLRLRNRTGFTRICEVTFRIGGVVRSTGSLEVEPSWNYRTWAYATLLVGDREGSVDVHVEDDTGASLANRSLPIRRGVR